VASADLLSELLRREKAANIKPDLDIDIFMKVIKQEELIVVLFFFSQLKQGNELNNP